MTRFLFLVLHGLVLTQAFVFPGKFGFLKRDGARGPFSQLRLDTQDDTSYLESEFQKLKKGDSVDYKSFVASDEVQSLIAQRLLSRTDVKKVWMKCMEKVTCPANFEQFVNINKEIDNLFDEEEDEEVDLDENIDDSKSALVDQEGSIATVGAAGTDGGDNEIDVGGDYQDPWDATVRPVDMFEEAYLQELRRYFTSATTRATARPLLTYDAFCQWSHFTELLQAGRIDRSCLQDIWQEATEYQSLRTAAENHPDPSAGEFATSRPSHMGENSGVKSAIDFDTFVRTVYRLEAVVQDIQEAVGSLGEEEVEGYYRSEFRRLCSAEGGESLGEGDDGNDDHGTTGKHSARIAKRAAREVSGEEGDSVPVGVPLLLSWSVLLEWEVASEMLHSKEISEADLRSMWDALPKKRMHHRGVVNRTGKGFGGDKASAEEWGIGEDAFVVLNSAIADILAVSHLQTQ